MSQPDERHDVSESDAILKWVDQVADRLDAEWQAALQGAPTPRLEDFVGQTEEPRRTELLHALIPLDAEYRHGLGECPNAEQYLRRFEFLDPEWVRRSITPDSGSTLDEPPSAPGNTRASSGTLGIAAMTKAIRIRCPHCQCPIQLVDDRPEDVLCPSCGSSFRLRDTRLTSTVAPMRQLGKFQLLERRGLGAFGAVWKAHDTTLDKIVALKIPHAGSLVEEVQRQRFFREARAAAQLRHPGIVAVHEVAELETESGKLPAIVSDFVDGVTLRELLETRRLTFRESAVLIMQLAEALHYAHSMGVVHRDIKPANVMLEYPKGLGLTAPLDEDSTTSVGSDAVRYGVPDSATARTEGLQRSASHHTDDGDLQSAGTARSETGPNRGCLTRPYPMILDFGLALRTDVEATMTVDGQRLGTPTHMSPEQASGQSHRVDARSDVYSLGVILYELLCEELPFRGSQHAIYRQVLNDEPQAPRRLNDKIPRDLETICLKALSKSPDRRYATARELADDLRRWQMGEPILARPVSNLERFWRWSKRNPRVTALSATVLMLGATIAMMLFDEKSRLVDLARDRERLARQAETEQRAEVQRQKQFVEVQRRRAITAEEQLEAQRDRAITVEQRVGAVRAEVERQQRLVEIERNRALMAEQRAIQPAKDALTALCFFELTVLAEARAAGREGHLGMDAAIRAAVDVAEPQIGSTFQNQPLVEASIRDTLGATYLYLSEPALAILQFERSQELCSKHFGPDHSNTIACMSRLANAYQAAGELDRAMSIFKETLERRKKTLGTDHQKTLESMNDLACAYCAAGKPNLTLRFFEETHTKMAAKLGSEHPETFTSMNNLAYAYHAAGKLDRALPLFKQLLEKHKTNLGLYHPYTLIGMHNLAATYRDAGHLDDAEPFFREAVTGFRRKLGFAHPSTQHVLHNLADCYAKLRQPEKAEPLLRELTEFWKKQAGADSPQYAGELASLGLNLLEQQKPADAEPLLRESLLIREKKQPDEWTTFNTKSQFGGNLLAQKNYTDAEPLLLSGYEGMKERQAKLPSDAKHFLKEALLRIVQLYVAWDQPDKADEWRKQLPPTDGQNPPKSR